MTLASNDEDEMVDDADGDVTLILGELLWDDIEDWTLGGLKDLKRDLTLVSSS